jgi:hypothetical protein
VIHCNVDILVISAYIGKQSKIERTKFTRKLDVRILIQRRGFDNGLYSFIWCLVCNVMQSESVDTALGFRRNMLPLSVGSNFTFEFGDSIFL